MKKIYINPVAISLQIEKSTKDRIADITKNQTDFINQAILEKLKREEK